MRRFLLRLFDLLPWCLWRCQECGSVLCSTSYPWSRDRTVCLFCKHGKECRPCTYQGWVDLRAPEAKQSPCKGETP